jgi:molybdopterin synthase sulfur carrier subunit
LIVVKILYFASLAETLGMRSEQLELPADCDSVACLVALLRARGEPFDATFDGKSRILVAINQQMSDTDVPISDSDEIAFFPPVTGG